MKSLKNLETRFIADLRYQLSKLYCDSWFEKGGGSEILCKKIDYSQKSSCDCHLKKSDITVQRDGGTWTPANSKRVIPPEKGMFSVVSHASEHFSLC